MSGNPSPSTLTIVTPSDRELSWSRRFRAPVAAPTHVSFTEVFDEAWYSGQALARYALRDEGATTLLVQTMTYESREARDQVLRSGFEAGVVQSHERLDAIFAG